GFARRFGRLRKKAGVDTVSFPALDSYRLLVIIVALFRNQHLVRTGRKIGNSAWCDPIRPALTIDRNPRARNVRLDVQLPHRGGGYLWLPLMEIEVPCSPEDSQDYNAKQRHEDPNHRRSMRY